MIRLLNGISNLIANLGTSKDKSASSTIDYRFIDDRTLDTMYQFDWLSAKVIDVPVEDMLREGRKINADGLEPGEIVGFENFEESLKLDEVLDLALKWSRLKGTSFIVLGLPGDTEVPIDIDQIKQGDLKFLKVIDRTRVSSININTYDPSSPDFDEPISYVIGGKTFHKSRLIRIDTAKKPPDSVDPYPMYGIPVLQRVYDAVIDAQSCNKIINSMLYEARINVVTVPGFTRLISSPGGEQQISNRFSAADKIKSINNMLILDEGETFTPHTTNFSGLSELMRTNYQIVSGASDIPATRLLGVSAQGLNATGDNDTRNYYDMLSSKQNKDLRKIFNQLDFVTTRSHFGFYPKNWWFEFNPLWQATNREIADINKIKADTDQIYFGMGVIDPSIIITKLHESGEYSAIDQEYVDAVSMKLEDQEEKI